MAKFCTKCGKALVDGKCQECEEKNIEKTETLESSDIKKGFLDCLEVVKGIFIKPKATIKNFKTEENYLVGIILMVISALSAGLFKIATVKNAYSVNVNNTNGLKQLGNMLLNGTVKSEPEYLKEFMTTFANNLLEYGLIVLLAYFVITNLLKGKTSLKEIASLVGIALSVVIIANLANSILIFIDGEAMIYLRSYISTFATIFKYLIIYEGINEISKNKEKLFISVASIFVFTTLVIDLLQKIFN